jgi:hypothetical protein
MSGKATLRFVAAMAFAVAVACAKSEQTTISSPDGGPIDSGDAGPPDAGPPDAGPPDAGPPDAGPPTFGGPGPWPRENVSYGSAEGLDLSWPGVVGFSTDETQNQWAATNSALYLMRPGDKTFRRYDASDGLHLQSNAVQYCDTNFAGGDKTCPIFGAASNPGITEITGGGPNEVFVGYASDHNWGDPNDGTWGDPFRHMGKVDRVRLKADGTLEVVRFDMVSGNTPMYWHDRYVFRLLYDHFIHKHELYVGTEHGIDKISPDKWFEPQNKNWPYLEYLYWMSDHLHPRLCLHEWCTGDEGRDTQMMGGWAALAIAPDGDLWAGSVFSAGKIIYTELAAELNPDGTPNPSGSTGWFQRGGSAYSYNFGERWCGSAGQVKMWVDGTGWVMSPCSPGTGWPPVFPVPSPGDPANTNAVTVTSDGMVWWSSPTYGIAKFAGHQFTYVTPAQVGTTGTVKDMVALPDGRLAIGTSNDGLILWNPGTGASTAVRAGSGLPDNYVNRLELDMMVSPPALHVSTALGATTLRVFP